MKTVCVVVVLIAVAAKCRSSRQPRLSERSRYKCNRALRRVEEIPTRETGISDASGALTDLGSFVGTNVLPHGTCFEQIAVLAVTDSQWPGADLGLVNGGRLSMALS